MPPSENVGLLDTVIVGISPALPVPGLLVIDMLPQVQEISCQNLYDLSFDLVILLPRPGVGLE